MVEVLLETDIGQLSNDLYSSINWSRVGLKTFKEFKNSIFQEFEERELRFNIDYEKITPFANEQIEMEYLNEVRYVGQEEEFNLEMFDIFSSDESTEGVQDELSLEGLSVSEDVLDGLVLKTDEHGFDYYGMEEEDFNEEGEVVSEETVISEEVEYVTPVYEEEVIPVYEEEPVSSFITEKVEPVPSKVVVQDDLSAILNEDVTFVKPEPRVVSVPEPAPRKREITYHEGMSLRQFLRENPRSTMEVAETYFTRREIMKEIQLGRVIKRGQKLFI